MINNEAILFSFGSMIGTIAVLWIIVWGAIRKYKKSFAVPTPEEKERRLQVKRQLDTVIVLTDAEKRGIRGNIWRGATMVGIVLLLSMSLVAWKYWRFAVKGEQIQAVVTSMHTETSSGRRHRGTSYVYTLKANVDGIVIKDTDSVSPRTGPSGGYDVNDVVDVYAATSGTHTDLALVDGVNSAPYSAGVIALFCGMFFGLSIFLQEKKIRSGQAKIKNLPYRLRLARLASASNPQNPKTPDGLPVYTIGTKVQ